MGFVVRRMISTDSLSHLETISIAPIFDKPTDALNWLSGFVAGSIMAVNWDKDYPGCADIMVATKKGMVQYAVEGRY